VIKHRLCFRLAAVSCARRTVLKHEYFGITVAANEYYVPSAFGEVLEFELFRMITEVWRKRRAPNLGNTHLDLGADERHHLKRIVVHVRNSWRAFREGNELLARYEFRTAETHWLRYGFSQMTRIAGDAILAKERRVADGKHNINRRWKNKETTSKRDTNIRSAAQQGKAIADLAESYGLTVRRIQQIIKTK
jgi:hypothetical protein